MKKKIKSKYSCHAVRQVELKLNEPLTVCCVGDERQVKNVF